MKKVLGLVLIIAAVIVLAHYQGLADRLAQARVWIASLGFWGPAVFILIYALAVTVLIPGSALTIAAGTIFGSLWGVVIVSIASTLGASSSFLIARYFARDLVSRWAQKQEKFAKLDELTKTRGRMIVAVTRLIPLFPYTLLNYGFGLTKVPFKTYVFYSWLCMLPGTLLYVVGTDAVVQTIINGKVHIGHVIAVAGAIVLIGFAAKYAKQALK